jgi:hypothetical protein
MKRKRIHNTKPSKTKEEQANAEGWIYVNKSKSIRGWNSIWVEEAQGNLGVDEEKALRP